MVWDYFPGGRHVGEASKGTYLGQTALIDVIDVEVEHLVRALRALD